MNVSFTNSNQDVGLQIVSIISS